MLLPLDAETLKPLTPSTVASVQVHLVRSSSHCAWVGRQTLASSPLEDTPSHT